MNKIQTPDFLGIAEGLKRDVRLYARKYCVDWFDDSFQNQGFTDAAFVPWEKRKNDKTPGRHVLIDTTFLRKSLAVLEEDATSMAFGTHVPYAGLHNNGERQRTVQYVRGYHNNNFMGKGIRVQIQPHTRKRDVKYPKRQFIGESQQMMKGLDTWFLNEVQKRFNP